MGKIEKEGFGHTELEQDEFLPKYELEYGLPDIPVKPKLYRYMDSDPNSAANTLFKYDYSSIEMLQEQSFTRKIYTDYNIGMRTNLVDRSIYKLPSGQSAKDIKDAMTEKLKFVLSAKDTYDINEGKQAPASKQIIIPSSFKAFSKINKYGGNIEDPFKLNVLKQD